MRREGCGVGDVEKIETFSFDSEQSERSIPIHAACDRGEAGDRRDSRGKRGSGGSFDDDADVDVGASGGIQLGRPKAEDEAIGRSRGKGGGKRSSEVRERGA